MPIPPCRAAYWLPAADALYRRYHDEEWGVPVHDDARLLELLILEGAQAGLSWITVLRKRERYRERMHGFDAQRLAACGPAEVDDWLRDPGLIRHRGKLEAAILNARACLALQAETRQPRRLAVGLGRRPADPQPPRTPAEVPASTPLSERLSRELRRRGFPLRRTDDGLRLPAGRRSGRRSHDRLLPLHPARLSEAAVHAFLPFPSSAAVRALRAAAGACRQCLRRARTRLAADRRARRPEPDHDHSGLAGPARSHARRGADPGRLRLLNQYLIVLTEPRPADVPLALFAKIGIEQLMSGIEGAQTTGPVEAQIGSLPAQRFEAIGVHDGHRLGYLYYALQGTRNQYQIVAWCAAEDFPRLKPTFQAVAETFREILR